MSCPAIKLKDLLAPFPAAQIGWRVGARTKQQDKGQALPYIDARDVQARLDEAVGAENWQVSFSAAPHGTGVLCSISIHVDDRWVVKQDGGQQDKDPDADSAAGRDSAPKNTLDNVKGALSDSFKRAAVMWGIGRYLYSYETPWVALKNGGKLLAVIPVLPDQFLPEAERGQKATTGTTSATDPTASDPTAAGTAPNAAPAASAKPMYDSSVAGDVIDPTADTGPKELFQSSVAGDMDDPSAEPAPPAANRRIDLPIVGTADQWSALSSEHKETVRLLTQRIEKKAGLPGVRSFLTEGKGATTLPEWVRKSLLTNVAAVSGDVH